jgi:hypothetical protein
MQEFIGIIKLKKKKIFENKRNYGIDLLRIFSMINIIILHINLCSGQLIKMIEKCFIIILSSLIYSYLKVTHLVGNKIALYKVN